MAENAGMERI